MAGETLKTTALTNRNSGTLREARLAQGTVRMAMDTHQFASLAAGLEVGDVLIMDLPIPSNAIIIEIAMHNDDLDTTGTDLVQDFGLAARESFESITSSTVTKNVEDDILDADLLVDGSTDGQAATTVFTVLTPDSATHGPEDRLKPAWELLGYDEDPKTIFNVCVTSQVATAGQSGTPDMAIRVLFVVD